MDFSNKIYRRWFTQGTIGILMTGAGISMVIKAGFYKHTHPDNWKWIAAGTVSLIVLMSGLVLFVDSIRYRIRYEDEVRDKNDKR